MSTPNRYAADILNLAATERPAALAQVPAHLRDWVRYYVEHYLPQLVKFGRNAARARRAREAAE